MACSKVTLACTPPACGPVNCLVSEAPSTGLMTPCRQNYPRLHGGGGKRRLPQLMCKSVEEGPGLLRPGLQAAPLPSALSLALLFLGGRAARPSCSQTRPQPAQIAGWAATTQPPRARAGGAVARGAAVLRDKLYGSGPRRAVGAAAQEGGACSTCHATCPRGNGPSTATLSPSQHLQGGCSASAPGGSKGKAAPSRRLNGRGQPRPTCKRRGGSPGSLGAAPTCRGEGRRHNRNPIPQGCSRLPGPAPEARR